MSEVDDWTKEAAEHHAAGGLAEAEELYRRVLARQPHRLEAIGGLGILLSQVGQYPEAVQLLNSQSLMRNATPLLLVALGAALLGTHEPDLCIKCMNDALRMDPNCAEAHNTLGCAYLEKRKYVESVISLRAAIKARASYKEAYYNLGRTLAAAGMHADAADAYRIAIRIFPGYSGALLSLGFALRELHDLDGAAESFRRAMSARTIYPEAMHNLGVTVAEQGRVSEGVAWLRRAVESDPANFHAHSALVYLMHFDPAFNLSDLAAEAARWNMRHAAPLMPGDNAFKNDSDPDRPLRIGYVSPDFRAHAEARFMLPLLEHHDAKNFEIHCYSSVVMSDDITAAMREFAFAWHEVRELSDAALAEKIRADGIDILVDLTMHMENHRLLTFARKPAPVQISWLAYPAGTGLAAIDYRMTDWHLEPSREGVEGPETNSESHLPATANYPCRPLRLPASWFCYQPAASAPQVSPLPALTAEGGVVTFGSLNTFRKTNPTLLSLWARLLQTLDAGGIRSRLLLVSPQGEHRTDLLAFFAAQSIAANRIELIAPMPYADYLATCHRIDIGLDTIPHNGATTTLDLLWMGVPVLGLHAAPPAPATSRLGTSILSTTGLTDWLAMSPDEYVQKALRFAQDLPYLMALRAGLREKLAASPLLDAKRFASHIELAYHTTWHAKLPQALRQPQA